MSCLNCGGNEEKLSMETVLYQSFGGWTIYHNGLRAYEAEVDSEDSRTLGDIEEIAKKTPGVWQAIFSSPLRGGTWTRNDYGEWVLTESNLGFA